MLGARPGKRKKEEEGDTVEGDGDGKGVKKAKS